MSTISVSGNSFKYIIIVVCALIIIGGIFFGIKSCMGPSVSDIIKERDKYKAQYEQIIKERDEDKKLFNAKILDLTKKYDALNKKYIIIIGERDNVIPPTTQDERINALNSLGITVITKR